MLVFKMKGNFIVSEYDKINIANDTQRVNFLFSLNINIMGPA